MTKRDKELPSSLAPQLVTPWCDLSRQREGAGLRSGEVHSLQFDHHLSHDVVPAVTVKGQHHKVQSQDLVEWKDGGQFCKRSGSSEIPSPIYWRLIIIRGNLKRVLQSALI